MADTLVARITGRDSADDAGVTLRLVMTDRALLAGAPDPAVIHGYGPVPAQVARDLIRRVLSAAEAIPGIPSPPRLWLRRLFAHPDTGELVAMDARSRRFPRALRELIALRDQTCRTSWCDAPIRHTDHVTPATSGGETSADNGEGLCERCNYDKDAPGWSVRPDRSGPASVHALTTTTPTGHTHSSRPPPLPGAA